MLRVALVAGLLALAGACGDESFDLPDAGTPHGFATADGGESDGAEPDVDVAAPTCGGEATLEGRVLTLGASVEVSEARVCVVGCGSCVLTDLTGRFVLEGVPGAEPAEVRVDKDGYVPLRLHIKLAGTVAAPLVARLPSLDQWPGLKDQASVMVWLREGPEGEPLGGAKLSLSTGDAAAYLSGGRSEQALETTGPDGAAVFVDLEDGEARVYATHLVADCEAEGASWPAASDGGYPVRVEAGSVAAMVLSCPRGPVELDGVDIHGQNHCYVDLSGASLREANLTGARLCGADLSGADLHGALLTGVDFSGADLRGARLVGAETIGATWDDAICPDGVKAGDCEGHGTCSGLITGSACAGVQLVGDDLSGKFLAELDVSGGRLEDVKLAGAVLTFANFDDTELEAVNFSGADLTGATFYGSSACSAPEGHNWSGATCPDGAKADESGGSCDGHLCP